MAVVLAGWTAIGRMLAVGVVRLGAAGPGCGAGCWEAAPGPLTPPDMGRMLAVGVRADWSTELSGAATGLACCGGEGRSVEVRSCQAGTNDWMLYQSLQKISYR